MPMDPAQGAPAEAQGSSGGGASQLLADAHTNLMKLQELMAQKMPEEAEKVGSIVQAIQMLAEDLNQPAGQAPKGPPGPATTTPEAGAANVKPAM